MKVNTIPSVSNVSFERGSLKGVQRITKRERVQLAKALGLDNPQLVSSWKPRVEFLPKGIIGAEFLPGIHVTAKGMTPEQAWESIKRIELAKIRGEIKPIPVSKFDL